MSTDLFIRRPVMTTLPWCRSRLPVRPLMGERISV